MSAPDPLPEPGQPVALPDGLVEAGLYPSEQTAFEHGLVVVAIGFDCWLLPSEQGVRLIVEERWLQRIRGQLEAYDRESLSWPPPMEPPPAPATRRMEFSTPLLWALGLLAAFWMQRLGAGRRELLGDVDSQAIWRRGELWRAATALLLHADVAHLSGNLLSGFFVFAALLPVFGRLRGWCLVAVSSVAANLLAALVNLDQDYRSLGASTSVFAGLGLLTGQAIRAAVGRKHPHRWRNILFPLASGLSLLALFGSSGLRTDLTAHLCGFGCGVAGGFLFARKTPAAGS